eukprot:11321835-Prorocentrum_lima.AAC.1
MLEHQNQKGHVVLSTRATDGVSSPQSSSPLGHVPWAFRGHMLVSNGSFVRCVFHVLLFVMLNG